MSLANPAAFNALLLFLKQGVSVGATAYRSALITDAAK